MSPTINSEGSVLPYPGRAFPSRPSPQPAIVLSYQSLFCGTRILASPLQYAALSCMFSILWPFWASFSSFVRTFLGAAGPSLDALVWRVLVYPVRRGAVGVPTLSVLSPFCVSVARHLPAAGRP